MTPKEHALHERLLDLWATRRATKAQILRCTELDRKSAFERREALQSAPAGRVRCDSHPRP